MSIDFTRPVTTRDGRPVRILYTDKSGEYPIVGLVMEGNYEAIRQWLPNGRNYKPLDSSWENPLDLINPVKKVYINLFKNDAGRMYYDTREEAEKAGNASNKANPFVGYIKTIEVEL